MQDLLKEKHDESFVYTGLLFGDFDVTNQSTDQFFSLFSYIINYDSDSAEGLRHDMAVSIMKKIIRNEKFEIWL